MPRLFVAIDLPEQQKKAVALLVAPLPGARWVPVEQIHLTLRFIGDIEVEQAQSVKKALASISAPSFSLALAGVGHFPSGRYPRVLWVGLEHNLPLTELQREVEVALVKAGVPAEQRPFSPHITLARLHGTPGTAVQTLEAAHRDFHTPPFTVDHFILYSSVLTHSGAIHHKEATYSIPSV